MSAKECLSFYKYLLVKAAKNKDGAALIEFAISLPFLLLMFLGAVDFTNMILVQQKLERVAFTIADLSSQHEGEFGIGNRLNGWARNVAVDMVRPFVLDNANYRLVVAAWTRTRNGTGLGGNWVYDKGFGAGNGVCNDNSGNPIPIQGPFGVQIPNTLTGDTPPPGERVIGTWLWYRYEPLLPGLARAVNAVGTVGQDLSGTVFIDGIQFHKRSFVRARTNTLTGTTLSRC